MRIKLDLPGIGDHLMARVELDPTDLEDPLRAKAEGVESRTSEADQELKRLYREKRRREEIQRCLAEMKEYGTKRQPGVNPAWDAAVAEYASEEATGGAKSLDSSSSG